MTIRAPKRNQRAASVQAKTVRVAAYARISVADREATQFSSVEAQVDAISAYVKSQASAGWSQVGEPYVDDGFSGSTTDRPALGRLLQDVAEGQVDAVVVHRFDRFSRSQRDFLNMLHVLEGHGVSFASVSQQLDTSTPMGRCMLNVMTAFAQMEREVIAERTRDKMIAARKKGLWTGGRPVLGYDVEEKRLVVNEEEAERVRAIYSLYLELGSLLPVVDELKRRAWKTKTWTNKKGDVVRGHTFTKNSLNHMLRNPLYVGRVKAGDETNEGVHDAIIDEEAWDSVQRQLSEHGQGKQPRRSRSSALLAGLVRCGVCGAGMTPSTSRKGTKRYAYYVCQTNQKQGAKACPGSRVSAGDLEGFVLDRIREIGRDPKVIEATLAADRQAQELRRPELTSQVRRLGTERSRLDGERRRLLDAITKGDKAAPALAERLGQKDEELRAVEQRQDEVRGELDALSTGTIDAAELREVLADLDPVWQELFPAERRRVLALFLERVEFDAARGEIAITFRPGGPASISLGTHETKEPN